MEEIKLVLVDDKAYNIQILEEKLAPKSEVKILFTACNGADFSNK
jgi:hypothetical protein